MPERESPLYASRSRARRLNTSTIIAERLRNGQGVIPGGNRVRQNNQRDYLVKTPSGGIPARSGTTLGSATCTIQDLSSSYVASDGNDVTVLNPSDAAIAGSIYIGAQQLKDGKFLADISGASASHFLFSQLQSSTTSLSSSLRFPQGAGGSTNYHTSDSSIFDVTEANGVVIKKGGIYSFDVTVLLTRDMDEEDSTLGLITVNNEVYDDSGTDRVQNLTEAEGVAEPKLILYSIDDVPLNLYVFDDSGSPSSNGLVYSIGVPGNLISHWGGNRAVNGIDNFTAEWHDVVSFAGSFSIEQSVIDAATGDVGMILDPSPPVGLSGSFNASIEMKYREGSYANGDNVITTL